MTGPASLQPTATAPARGASRDAALRDAARQLEGVFVSMMFEEMAKASGGDGGLFPKSPGRKMYEQWFRGEVATQFARDGGLGLGDTIAAHLGGPPSQGLPVADRVAARKAPPPPPATARDRRRPPPVEGRVTSGYGPRVHPVTGRAEVHAGVDLAVPIGTPVRAPYAGRVTKVERDPHLGLHVVVEHRGGYSSLYAHLSDTDLSVGQRVDAAATLGSSGRSGRTTGPHLHFALYRHGEPVDPARWIRLGPRS